MGSLILTPGSTICIDANVLIYSVERVPAYWPLLEPLWRASAAGTINVAGSELLVIESLVAPLKSNDAPLVARYEGILFSGELVLHPISIAILRSAAELRATHGLKTPDAIHAAAATQAGCDCFLTNDSAFMRIPKLNAVLLSQVLQSP